MKVNSNVLHSMIEITFQARQFRDFKHAILLALVYRLILTEDPLHPHIIMRNHHDRLSHFEKLGIMSFDILSE